MTDLRPGTALLDVVASESGPLFELAPELEIDTDVARRVIAEFIRGQLRQAGFERTVLGLSGGIDSAVVAFLIAEAIGAERLLCVSMPYATSSRDSLADALLVTEQLGAASATIPITAMVDGYFGAHGGGGAEATSEASARDPGAAATERRASPTAPGAATGTTLIGAPRTTPGAAPDGATASTLRRGNFMARTRMMVLYDRSAVWGGLVVGTGNKTESLIGYTTHFGDDASAFNPIGDLYKSQVRQLAVALGVPETIIRKAPSADLWPGQTDESEAGFSYPELDRLLFWMIDRRRSPEELVELGFDRATVERVDRMVSAAEFKRQVPPIAKLGPRTPGIDYLYPRRRPGSKRG